MEARFIVSFNFNIKRYNNLRLSHMVNQILNYLMKIKYLPMILIKLWNYLKLRSNLVVYLNIQIDKKIIHYSILHLFFCHLSDISKTLKT